MRKNQRGDTRIGIIIETPDGKVLRFQSAHPSSQFDFQLDREPSVQFAAQNGPLTGLAVHVKPFCYPTDDALEIEWSQHWADDVTEGVIDELNAKIAGLEAENAALTETLRKRRKR